MVQRSLWELPNGYKLLLSVPEGSNAQYTVYFSHVNGHKINRSFHASTVKLPNLIYCLLTDIESSDTLQGSDVETEQHADSKHCVKVSTPTNEQINQSQCTCRLRLNTLQTHILAGLRHRLSPTTGHPHESARWFWKL